MKKGTEIMLNQLKVHAHTLGRILGPNFRVGIGWGVDLQAKFIILISYISVSLFLFVSPIIAENSDFPFIFHDTMPEVIKLITILLVLGLLTLREILKFKFGKEVDITGEVYYISEPYGVILLYTPEKRSRWFIDSREKTKIELGQKVRIRTIAHTGWIKEIDIIS